MIDPRIDRRTPVMDAAMDILLEGARTPRGP